MGVESEKARGLWSGLRPGGEAGDVSLLKQVWVEAAPVRCRHNTDTASR